MPKSYILPTFEAWALPLRNALLERLPVSFAFGKDLPAKLEVLPCAAAFAPAAELTLTIDGHPWRAYFENRALLPLHPLFSCLFPAVLFPLLLNASLADAECYTKESPES